MDQVMRDQAFSAFLNGIRAIQTINSKLLKIIVVQSKTRSLTSSEERALDEVAKVLENETYDYEGYRQRLSLAARIESFGVERFSTWISSPFDSIIGRSSTEVQRDLVQRIDFLNEVYAGKPPQSAPFTQVQLVSYCATSGCRHKFKCLFQFSQDFLDILSVPFRFPGARQVSECVRLAQEHDSRALREVLTIGVQKSYVSGDGFGWPTKLGGQGQPDPLISVSMLEFLALGQSRLRELWNWAMKERVFENVVSSMRKAPWESVIVIPSTEGSADRLQPDKSLSVTLEVCRGLMTIIANTKGSVREAVLGNRLLESGVEFCLQKIASEDFETHTYGRDRYTSVGNFPQSEVRGVIELLHFLLELRGFARNQAGLYTASLSGLPQDIDICIRRVLQFQHKLGFWRKVSDENMGELPSEFRECPEIYNLSFINTFDATEALVGYLSAEENPYCPACHEMHAQGAKYCTKCGVDLI